MIGYAATGAGLSGLAWRDPRIHLRLAIVACILWGVYYLPRAP